MKKICRLFVIMFMAIFVASCSNITESGNTPTQSQKEVNGQQTIENNSQKSISSNPVTDYNNYSRENSKEKKEYSNTIAVSNAIIVDDDHEHNVVYKKKCDACGYIEPGTTSITPGSRVSTFTCPDCGETRTLELKTQYYNE